jgi:hypothetical protein
MILQDRLNKLSDMSIDRGPHATMADGHCALELVAWLADEPHTDHPGCVSPMIAEFVRRWNDDLDDNARARLLRPILPRLIDTTADDALDMRRRWMIADWLVRVYTPAWLALLPALADAATALQALPEIRSTDMAAQSMPLIAAARQRSAAAWAAAGDAAWVAAGDAAWAAAGDATWVAARAAAGAAAGDVAWVAASRAAAWVAARAAAWAAAGDAAWVAAGDAAGNAARDAAGDAAWARLSPTVAMLQGEALTLIDHLITAQGAA